MKWLCELQMNLQNICFLGQYTDKEGQYTDMEGQYTDKKGQ